MVTQNNILGGTRSPIDLSIAAPGGFSPTNPIPIPFSGVSFTINGLTASTHPYVLVPDVPPWNIELRRITPSAANHFFDGGTALGSGTGSGFFNITKYTGGVPIIISGRSYSVYCLSGSYRASGTTLPNLNIR
jgi:hypothetical protein